MLVAVTGLFFAREAAAQHQRLIIVQQSEQTVAVFDPVRKKMLHQVGVGYKPHEITCDPVKKVCYVTDFGVEDYDTRLGRPGKTISVIDPIRGNRLRVIETTPDSAGNMPHGIKIRPGAYRELFVNIEKGDSMLVFDANQLQIIRRYALPAGTHNFVFSADGKRLWLMCGAGGVAAIDPQTGRMIHQLPIATPIRGLSVAGKDLLASGVNELYVLSADDLHVKQHIEKLGVRQLFYSGVDPTNHVIVAPAALDSAVLLLDRHSGRLLTRLQTQRTPLQVQFIGQSAFITHPLADSMTIIDTRTRRIAGSIPVKGGNGLCLFSY